MRFVCDAMLGKLAKYLRILGFDTVYAPNAAGPGPRPGAMSPTGSCSRGERALPASPRPSASQSEHRPRAAQGDKGADKARNLSGPPCSAGASNATRSWSRRTKRTSSPLVPEFVYHHYAAFKRCPSCRRVYWEGSHTAGMAALLEEMLS